MGAHFTCETFDENLDSTELRRRYKQRVDELTHEYGTDPYNGTLATTNGLIVEEKTFDSRHEAEEYVQANTEKWQAARAVRYKDMRTETVKEPTFNEKPRSQLGYVAAQPRTLRTVAFHYPGGGARVTVAADQLTAAQKATALALFNDYDAKASAFNAARRTAADMIAKLQVLTEKPPTAAWLGELQRTIKQRAKAHAAATKAANKLTAFDEKHAAKLYVTKQVDHGVKWLVGGWAAC